MTPANASDDATISLRLVILMGLQASGKSTFVRTRPARDHVVVSKNAWPNARNKQRRQLALIAEHLT